MVTTVTLQPPFEYYWWLILIGVIFLLGAGALLFLAFRKLFLQKPRKAGKEKPVMIKPTPQSLAVIKQKYTEQLRALMDSYAKKTVSKRDGYQRLSLLIRGFVTDVTGINVEIYTKTEIQDFGIKSLDNLMNEYYIPEFGEAERAKTRDFTASCNKTLKVIQSWK